MKDFIVLFNKVFISVTNTDIAMFDKSTPIINIADRKWMEFVTGANKALSPNLTLINAYMSNDGFISAFIDGGFCKNSASTLNAHFSNWFITANEDFDDDGRPLGSSLLRNIPYVDSI
jgi:hypothetical protein